MVKISREDTHTAEPTVTGREEAAIAAFWETVVCRLHDVDYWEFVKGWDTYERSYTWGWVGRDGGLTQCLGGR